MTNSAPPNNPTQLLASCPQEDGSHSGTALWRAIRRGEVLKVRRGVYVPTR